MIFLPKFIFSKNITFKKKYYLKIYYFVQNMKFFGKMIFLANIKNIDIILIISKYYY